MSADTGVEHQLLHNERSRMIWSRHLVRTSPRCLPLKRCTDWEETPEETYILEGLHLPAGFGVPGDPQEELEEVSRQKDIWAAPSALPPLHCKHDPDKCGENGWMEGLSAVNL